jgi:P-type Cu+ transporter
MNQHVLAMTDSPAVPTCVIDITGMHCAGCAGVIEKALERLAGPGNATVNLTLERADIRGMIDVLAAVATIEAAGYGASPRLGTTQERQAQREKLQADRRADDRKTFLLFVVAALLFLPFLFDMLAALLGYGHGTLLSPGIQLALATPVQFICGWRFIRGAWFALLRRAANMDVLIALGTLTAFGLSVWRVYSPQAVHDHTLAGQSLYSGQALYFEGSVAVIAFVLLGKVLEANARAETVDTMTALGRDQAHTVLVFRGGIWLEAPAASLKQGEIFAVKPGQRAVADGFITQGTGEMDESLVTGESIPAPKSRGDRVIAGALNGNNVLTVEATAVGEDATVARIARLVEAAQIGKAPGQKLADRVSALFVPVVLLIAVATGLIWWGLGQTETAIIAAVSVLVVSCPCALGLATPVALVAGMGSAARSGILVRDATALETAARIDTIAFDKTGTLTEGHPRLSAISAPGVGPDEALKIALALSLASEHPLSMAVRDAAADRDLTTLPASDLEVVPGSGVQGKVNGVKAMLGSAEFIRSQGISLGVLEQVISRDPGFGEAQTISWLAISWLASSGLASSGLASSGLAGTGRIIGALAFVDGIRSHAEQVIGALKQEGFEIIMVSGDRPGAALVVGNKLGITDVRAGLQPATKVTVMKALAASGKRVAMVGDGLNDTPALAAAELGIAMASGTQAARAAAGVTLMRSDLRLIPKALQIARETSAVIRQNLWLAFVFNGVGIPLAASGYLTPAVAGAAMASSSVLVVLNALRLSRKVF